MTILLALLLACQSGGSPGSGGDGGDGGATGDGGAVADGGSVGDGGTTSDGGASGWSDGVDGELVAASRADLRLKRWRQLSQDLEGALELRPDQVCREAGLYDCTELHVVPLGGVSVPNGLYRPIDTISATTGLASERMVLQACWNREKLDVAALAAGQAAVVFGQVDLAASALSEEDATAQLTELYRRLLARDPAPEEVTALVGLHASIIADGGTNADWALLSCFSIGTTTEALSY